jgi:hypothetical protein
VTTPTLGGAARACNERTLQRRAEMMAARCGRFANGSPKLESQSTMR